MISIAIPIHLKGKPQNKPYEYAIKHYSKLGYPVNICGSEGELSRKFAEPFLSDLVKYVEVPQGELCTSSSGSDVLREKFNDSLKTLPLSDWYCLVGANDLASKEYFEELEKLDKKVGMAGVGMNEKLYLVGEDMKAYSVKLKYSNKFDLLAGVNSFTHFSMVKCSFRPYQLKGCETGAELFFRPFVYPLKGSVTMFKSQDDLNSLEKILKTHQVVKISQEELDYIESLVY
jgi:hypothetical protein